MSNCGITLEYLMTLARNAGEIIKQNFRHGAKFEWKEDESPVTMPDKIVNSLVVNQISELFPGVKVIAEEGSGGAAESNWTIVCDPIDGTSGFGTGIPTISFCISLLEDGQPVMACIYDPILDRMYTAEKGKGSSLNGKPIHVSDRTTLHRTHMGLVWWKNCPYDTVGMLPSFIEAGATVMAPVSIAYWAALVAAGELGGTVFPSSKPWETAAIKLLVEEAGGRVTDILGNTQERYDGDIRGHIASNGRVHDEIVAITRAACEK